MEPIWALFHSTGEDAEVLDKLDDLYQKAIKEEEEKRALCSKKKKTKAPKQAKAGPLGLKKRIGKELSEASSRVKTARTAKDTDASKAVKRSSIVNNSIAAPPKNAGKSKLLKKISGRKAGRPPI